MFWDFGSLYQEASRRQTASCCGSGRAVSKKTLRRPISRLLRQRQCSMCVAGDVIVFIADCEPICARQACIVILQVAAIERVAPEMDISVSSHRQLQHVMVQASRPTSKFGLRHWPSILRCQSISRREWRHSTFLHSVRSSPSLSQGQADYFGVKVEGPPRDHAGFNPALFLPKKLDAKVVKLHFPALLAELTPNSSQIELLECRLRQEPSMAKNCCPSSSSSARRLRQEPSITDTCWTSSSSKWKLCAQVARRVASKSAGSTASTTHPVPQGRLRNQRNVAQKPWGGPPSCDPAPLTTSFGSVGQWERRHRAMVERKKGRRPKNRPSDTRGGDPKTDLRKEELSKQLGREGRGPENPGVVAPLTFCKLSRQLLVGLNEHRWWCT